MLADIRGSRSLYPAEKNAKQRSFLLIKNEAVNNFDCESGLMQVKST